MFPVFSDYLAQQGLNLQFVFDLHDLPDEVIDSLPFGAAELADYRQLILLGHGGTLLWQRMKLHAPASEHPINHYTVEQIAHYFEHFQAGLRYQVIYPSDHPIGLQGLGKLAGWHYDSPFRVGVHPFWGSWYAYRAVVIADTALSPSLRTDVGSPCTACMEKPCVQQCPVGAAKAEGFDSSKCIAYRKTASSECHYQCLARNSCPVGTGHRYTQEQINYHYGCSLAAIRKYY